jgi:hypothetical protein
VTATAKADQKRANAITMTMQLPKPHLRASNEATIAVSYAMPEPLFCSLDED